MGQALCSSLEDDLLDYFRLIAVLEAQLNQNRTSLTLRRLSVWSQDPLERLRVSKPKTTTTTTKKSICALVKCLDWCIHG
jgi:hypothetical protein